MQLPEAALNDRRKPRKPQPDGGNVTPAAALSSEDVPCRSDGRPFDTGLVRPYRPCPADFRERYLEMGWDKKIEEHYRTNWRCIRRWIDEVGGEDLRAERREITGAAIRPELRSKRYVLGRTLSPVKPRKK